MREYNACMDTCIVFIVLFSRISKAPLSQYDLIRVAPCAKSPERKGKP